MCEHTLHLSLDYQWLANCPDIDILRSGLNLHLCFKYIDSSRDAGALDVTHPPKQICGP